MGMTFDPDVIAAGKKALDDFGAGTTGSRVLNGTYQGHKECEDALKDFYGMEPCHGVLHRLPGQSRHGLDAGRQGRLHHPRRRQPRLHL
jgi:8-amino-7-oxononanoate synthase